MLILILTGSCGGPFHVAEDLKGPKLIEVPDKIFAPVSNANDSYLGLRLCELGTLHFCPFHVRFQLRSPISSTHLSAAAPSPYSAGRESGGANECTASTIFTASEPTRRFQPASTVSTHSVSFRSVRQGAPSQYASFCSPPESVITSRAEPTSATISR